jgi:hypothetical protein
MSGSERERPTADELESRLWDLLLERSSASAAELERARTDERLGPALARIEAELGRTARAYAAGSRPVRPEEALLSAERALARTSRAGPFARARWRAFAEQSLGRSFAWRVAAASVLLHLVALPALAWWAIARQAPPKPVIQISFDEVEPALPAENAEPERPLDEPIDPERAAPQGALARRLLEARTHLEAGAPLAAWAAQARGIEQADELERALWLELLLDARSAGSATSGLARALAAPAARGAAADFDRLVRTRAAQATAAGEAPDASADAARVEALRHALGERALDPAYAPWLRRAQPR